MVAIRGLQRREQVNAAARTLSERGYHATSTGDIVDAHLLLSVVDEAAPFIAHVDDRTTARDRAGRALGALLAGIAAG